MVTAQTPWEEGVVGLLLARGLRARFVSQLHFDLFSEDWAREHWLNRWRRKVATSVLKRSSMIRVVSSTQAYKLAKSLGLPEEQLRVVPVGVHFEPAVGTGGEFKEALAPSLSRHLVVLFVGRFVPAKDLNLWVRVAELIAQHRPDVAFVLAGSGPLEKSIRDLVEKKGLLDRFHFLGAVAHKDLPSVYAAADLFLLSSSNEGFGRVILEAALAGVAVVSTSCAGPADLVEHGETGILCPVGDAGALATAALSLLGDESLRHRLSKAARFRVRENYNSEALTERLVACWADA